MKIYKVYKYPVKCNIESENNDIPICYFNSEKSASKKVEELRDAAKLLNYNEYLYHYVEVEVMP